MIAVEYSIGDRVLFGVVWRSDLAITVLFGNGDQGVIWSCLAIGAVNGDQGCYLAIGIKVVNGDQAKIGETSP